MSVSEPSSRILVAPSLTPSWRDLLDRGDTSKLRRLYGDRVEQLEQRLAWEVPSSPCPFPFEDQQNFLNRAYGDVVYTSVPEAEKESPKVPFQELLLPLTARVTREAATSDDPILLVMVETASDSLLKELAEIAAPVLYFEFQTERAVAPPGYDTYQMFIQRNTPPRDLFRRYPHLARLLAEICLSHLHHLRTLAADFQRDRTALEDLFSLPQSCRITSCRPFLSDRHDGGRTVTKLSFENGLSLAYKPKSLAMDAAWSQFLSDFNKLECLPPFYTPKVIDRGDHGWQEWLEHTPCQDENEVREFFVQAGALTAFFYVTAATDCHWENFIAVAGRPVLIDAETLFHPDTVEQKGRRFHGVVRSGYLPHWERTASGYLWESGGLRASSGEPAVEEKYAMMNSHWMKRKTVLKEQEPAPNMPLYKGRTVTTPDYLDALLSGFETAYSAVLAKRETSPSARDLFAAFQGHPVRLIYRNTKLYADLIDQALGPESMGSGQPFGHLFESLYDASALNPHLPKAIPAHEQRALEHLDIPVFFGTADSLDLTLSNGNRIPHAFTESAFELVDEILQQLGAADLQRQKTIIAASLKSGLEPHLENATPSRGHDPMPKSSLPQSPASAILAATAIASRLMETAFDLEDEGLTWVAPCWDPNRGFYQPQPIGDDLFEGRFGPLLFLHFFDQISKSLKYKGPVRRTLKAITAQLTDVSKIAENEGFGGAQGLGAYLYGISLFMGEEKPGYLMDALDRLLSNIDHQASRRDEKNDLVYGNAGFISALCKLQQMFPSDPRIPRLLAPAAERLHNQISIHPAGWILRGADGSLEAGLAHGVAGPALAFSRLAELDHFEAFREDAVQLWRYVHGAFDGERGHFPVKHGHAVAPGNAAWNSWCRGTAGIGLAALACPDQSIHGFSREELLLMGNTTVNQEPAPVNHICCGNAARILFLLELGDRLGEPTFTDAARKRTLLLHRPIAEQPLHENQFLPPGFFQGSSGIGYTLLKLAHPRLVNVITWS